MTQVILENEGLLAVVRPDLGAGLGALSVKCGGRWLDVLRSNLSASAFNDLGCYVLAPWSNRIRGGKFVWRGRDISLRPDWPDGTAIHGDVKEAAFVMLDRSPQSVRLVTRRGGHLGGNWPWEYECVVRYQIEEAGLAIAASVRNVGTETMPCGLGLHPYFVPRLRGKLATVRLNARGRYPCEGMMPVAAAKDDELSAAVRSGWRVEGGLDDVFSLSDEFAAVISWGDILQMRMTTRGGSRHAVIYSGAKDDASVQALCVEPVTHVNDGFNLAAQGWSGTSVRELAAGEEMKLETEIEFECLSEEM